MFVIVCGVLFVLSFMFVIVCGDFEWNQSMCSFVFIVFIVYCFFPYLLFVYICIIIGDPTITSVRACDLINLFNPAHCCACTNTGIFFS
jgi:hypothetical protein